MSANRFSHRQRKASSRRGAVAVEFACVAPIFVVIFLGSVQASRLFEVQAELTAAAREGARLASMDRRNLVMSGQSVNDKMEQEVRSYLTLHGLPGDTATVIIADNDNPQVPFDVNDPKNNQQFFQVRVELPYAAVGGLRFPGVDNINLRGRVIFRNSRAITSS